MFSVVGNVGCGKTTILKEFQKLGDLVAAVCDPHAHCEERDFPTLVRNMMHFHREEEDQGLVVWENNPYFLSKVFNPKETITPFDPLRYSMYKTLVQKVYWKPRLMFCVDLDSVSCARRCNRSLEEVCEVGIRYEYFLRHLCTGIVTVHLDGNLPAGENAKIILEYILRRM